MEVTETKSTWELRELETFFNHAQLPEEPLKINVRCEITDLRAFIDSHLSLLGLHEGDINYLPYLERLHHLREWIQNRDFEK